MNIKDQLYRKTMNTCWYHRKEPAVNEVFFSPDYDSKVGVCEECNKKIGNAGGQLTRKLHAQLQLDSGLLVDRHENK